MHDLGCALRQHMPLKAVLECASARKGEPVSAASGISIATLPMMFSECLVPRVGKHGGKEGPRYRQQSQDEGVREIGACCECRGTRVDFRGRDGRGGAT